MWRYRNPVDVKFGAGVFETLGKVLAGRAYCLVTYDDANGGGVFADLDAARDRPGRRTRRDGDATSVPIPISSASRTPAAPMRAPHVPSRPSWHWAAVR